MDRIVYTGPEYSIKILQQRLGNMFKIVCVEPTPEDLLPEFEKCTVFLDASMKVPIDDISISKATKLACNNRNNRS